MNKQIENALYKKYVNEALPELRKTFGDANYLSMPEIKKVIVNMGLKKAKDDKTVLEEAQNHIAAITGQKPVVTKAKKAISNFGIKKGNPIGCMVTLRGRLMYIFLEKLLRIVIPRIRDFSGIKKSIDRFGNLTIGLRDESIFPEIDPDSIKTTKGMSITIVTDKEDREKSEKLYELLEFPFKKV